MDLMDYGTIVLAALMVWLLYRVTRETHHFIAPDKQRTFRPLPASSAPRALIPGVKTRRG